MRTCKLSCKSFARFGRALLISLFLVKGQFGLTHARVWPSQHVTVGIVGGSDLSKICEQLGKDGGRRMAPPCDYCLVRRAILLKDFCWLRRPPSCSH